MQTLSRALGFAVALAATMSPALRAQGWIDPIRPVPTSRIERIRSAVQVSVSGRVARVTVEEWFRNSGPTMDEGVYHFPLPGEAVFSSYSLWQGDQELRGEAMDAAQARAIYEAIVRQKRDPALIELVGQGMIRARVFPSESAIHAAVLRGVPAGQDSPDSVWQICLEHSPDTAEQIRDSVSDFHS